MSFFLRMDFQRLTFENSFTSTIAILLYYTIRQYGSASDNRMHVRGLTLITVQFLESVKSNSEPFIYTTSEIRLPTVGYVVGHSPWPIDP